MPSFTDKCFGIFEHVQSGLVKLKKFVFGIKNCNSLFTSGAIALLNHLDTIS